MASSFLAVGSLLNMYFCHFWNHRVVNAEVTTLLLLKGVNTVCGLARSARKMPEVIRSQSKVIWIPKQFYKYENKLRWRNNMNAITFQVERKVSSGKVETWSGGRKIEVCANDI